MLSRWKLESIKTIMVIGISLIILTVLIFFISKQPMQAISSLFLGPFKNSYMFGEVLVQMTPLMFTGVATCLIFSSNSLNLSAESAFSFAALMGTLVASSFHLPGIILLPLILLIGMVAGGLVTSVPAYLKMKTKSDEMVVSLMLNYIVFLLCLLILNAVRDPTIPTLATKPISSSVVFPILLFGTRVNAGFIIALLVTILGYLALYRIRWGTKVRIIGTNNEFAQSIGYNVPFVTMSTQIIGGAIAGLGGVCVLLGLYDRYSWLNGTNYGWDGILLATMAKNNPIFVPLAALFLGYLRIGSDIMSQNTDVPQEVLSIVQGLIIILIIAEKLARPFEKYALYKKAKQEMFIQETDKQDTAGV
jgi:ABC-type uncharacterized transport system permease subunit